MSRGDMSRGALSLWESPSTTLQGSASGRTDITARQYKVHEEVPRRVFDDVNSRAEIGELPRRAFDEVNTNPVLTTAVDEGGLRGSICERETWAKVARGGYGPVGNEPLCMQGDRCGELVDDGCRSGESSYPRPVVGYESSHEIAPKTCGEYGILIALPRDMQAYRSSTVDTCYDWSSTF